jgi:hypothetical protein
MANPTLAPASYVRAIVLGFQSRDRLEDNGRNDADLTNSGDCFPVLKFCALCSSTVPESLKPLLTEARRWPWVGAKTFKTYTTQLSNCIMQYFGAFVKSRFGQNSSWLRPGRVGRAKPVERTGPKTPGLTSDSQIVIAPSVRQACRRKPSRGRFSSSCWPPVRSGAS